MAVLGIDLGTSALKAVIVDGRQSVLAEASAPLTISTPRPGWSEQDPASWWQALETALERLRQQHPAALRDVRALGLAGQMHGAVLLDKSGEVIRPAILWNDSRAGRECELLQEEVPDLEAIAGIVAMPGFTAPKLLWLRRSEPQSFAQIWKILSPKDYLRFRLTCEAVTDMSDAAGTLWLDQAARDWSGPILAATGLDRTKMPRLVEGTAPAGRLSPGMLQVLGMEGPVLVAGGAGDAAAAGIGIGAIDDGDAFISLGTSAQFFVTDDRYRPQPHTLLHAFAHALPDRWFRMAAMLNGASCLDWAARFLGAGIEHLLARVEASYAGPSRVIFLPYLSGERTPHNDSSARGVFSGLDATSGAGDLFQAVLEGVAFSLLEARISLEAAGVRLSEIAAVGGGARSRFWMQMISDVLGRPIVRYAGGEKGPAFGAARLALIADGEGEPAEICAKPVILDRFVPRAGLSAAYAKRLPVYQRLYQSLKPEFVRSAQAFGGAAR